MHSILKDVLQKLQLETPSLEKAARRSTELVAQFRKDLQQRIPSDQAEGLDVLACGSIARQEATSGSDLDAVVIVHVLPTDVTLTRRLLSEVTRIQEELSLAEPGRTGMFGGIVSVADIVERIGLEQDTNLIHSRRILFLLESVSIYDPGQREKLIRSLIDRYLVGASTTGVPRFLLNDLMKYWRTIAVDYQAKRWEKGTSDWGLRYLKLLVSRKLTYVSALVSLFLTENATTEYFWDQFSMPALSRIAQLHGRLESSFDSDLRLLFEVADHFVGKLDSSEFREQAKAVESLSNAEKTPEFADVREKAKNVQLALERIFFESKLLRDRSVKYLSF